MSLITLLQKIWKGIKGLFEKIEPQLQKAVHTGVQVVDVMKDIVGSPGADLLTAIIPGELDDTIKIALRAALPKLLVELKLVDAAVGLTNPKDIVAAGVTVLQQLDGDVKSAFLHNLSIMIAQVAADGKLSWSDGVYILEWYYQNRYK